MITLLLHLLRLLPLFFGGYRQLAIENLALRQQLAVYKRSVARPRLRTADRLFWIGLTKVWTEWRQSLVFVTPETVLRWHPKEPESPIPAHARTLAEACRLAGAADCCRMR
jgi:hypothetical protein